MVDIITAKLYLTRLAPSDHCKILELAPRVKDNNDVNDKALIELRAILLNSGAVTVETMHGCSSCGSSKDAWANWVATWVNWSIAKGYIECKTLPSE